jgi:membrane protease YdiL (CAAX protease family)
VVQTGSVSLTARRDFPFYAGQPRSLSFFAWVFVLVMAAAGFAALIGLPSIMAPTAGRWLGIALFVGLPLIGLAIAAGPSWVCLFPPLRWRDVWIGLVFVPVNMAVSAAIALLVMKVSVTANNPSSALLEHLKGLDLGLFLGGAVLQLIGEELVTILPLLALLTAFHAGLKAPRLLSIGLAWILSALLFGALHLPTYEWHLVQALVGIGAARLVLSLPYLITKSLWSSVITHVTNDMTMFLIVIAAHGLKATPGPIS